MLDAFIDKHKLDQDYKNKVIEHYNPMIQSYINIKNNNHADPVIIGVNGCQGSGKSTVSEYMGLYIEKNTDYKTVVFSLDDFYLTKHNREMNAQNIHPLLSVRGVPGTHDTKLLQRVINQLKSGQPAHIPKFNKALDEVEPKENWTVVDHRVDFVIIEGWCLGVSAQNDAELKEPVNALEKNEDVDGVWRTYVNNVIKQDYKKIYDNVEHWVVLKAPSFSTVYKWRKEQEDKLRFKLSKVSMEEKSNIMSDEQVLRFIQFFERLTTHGFKTLPDIADFCFELDENRDITQQSTIQKNNMQEGVKCI